MHWTAFINLLLRCNLLLYQTESVSSAHHVVGVDRQQQFEFVRVDVEVGLDRVPGPDGPSLKHLGTKRLVWDKIKAWKRKEGHACVLLSNIFQLQAADAVSEVAMILMVCAASMLKSAWWKNSWNTRFPVSEMHSNTCWWCRTSCCKKAALASRGCVVLPEAHRPVSVVLQPLCQNPSGRLVSSWVWPPPGTHWAQRDQWSWQRWHYGADEPDSNQ